jgi:hypothetical protein
VVAVVVVAMFLRVAAAQVALVLQLLNIRTHSQMQP